MTHRANVLSPDGSGTSVACGVRGVIFDLDGTIYRGGVPIPGAASAITALRTAGVRVVFASNNPTANATDYAHKLTALGIEASERDVLTSGGVAGRWLQSLHPAARVFVIGEPSLIGELTSIGVDVIDHEEADIVLASFDRTFDYAKWNTGFQALRKNALFVITNPDATCPVAGGMVPDCAGIAAALETTSGRTVDVVIGKPSAVMLQAALERLAVPPESILIVGDRLETDIEMGRVGGVRTVLVLSGVTNLADVNLSPVRPSHLINSIHDLPELLGLAVLNPLP